MCFTCGGSSNSQPRSGEAGDKGEEGGNSQEESAFRSWLDTLRDRLGLTKKPNPSPRDDPFYGVDTPSSALDKYAPGAIIRSREVRIADFPDFDAHKVKVWQLAVRSTTPHGKSQVFVATVIRPPNATGDKIVTQCPKVRQLRESKIKVFLLPLLLMAKTALDRRTLAIPSAAPPTFSGRALQA